MIEALKTFMAVVEYKNFTKAAEAIRLSQPSVSLHIKQLEQYFGAILIIRSSKQKKITITSAGYLLYERAGEIINILDKTKSELTRFQDSVCGELRIGASFTIGEYILPAFLGKFSKEYPDLTLEVKIGNTAAICDMVTRKELDIGLIEGIVSIRLLLGIAFVFITAPVAGHLICRAAYRSGVKLAEETSRDDLKEVIPQADTSR